MKGRVWCDSLSVVRVAKTASPKPFTLIVPYYENPKFLAKQVDHWNAFPQELRDLMSVIVVDDGSPDAPAESVMRGVSVMSSSCRLFRIEVDCRWNWLAARNVGAHHAADGWMVLTDMDHVIPATTAYSLIYGKHDPSVIYAFSRREHTGSAATPHSASFFLTREMFWKVGGYDERMSGYYGSDGYFRRRLVQQARIVVLTDELIRHEYQGDSSTSSYKRKQPEDARLRQIVANFPKNSKPKVLSFPYREVAPC